MDMPRGGKSPEPIFLDREFRFDQPSEELQKIKRALSSGMSASLALTDMPDDKGASRIEVLVCFIDTNGTKYLSDLREVHGECLEETSGENVMELGIPCEVTRRITDALFAGCDVYLVPEEGQTGGVSGEYTFCRLVF